MQTAPRRPRLCNSRRGPEVRATATRREIHDCPGADTRVPRATRASASGSAPRTRRRWRRCPVRAAGEGAAASRSAPWPRRRSTSPSAPSASRLGRCARCAKPSEVMPVTCQNKSSSPTPSSPARASQAVVGERAVDQQAAGFVSVAGARLQPWKRLQQAQAVIGDARAAAEGMQVRLSLKRRNRAVANRGPHEVHVLEPVTRRAGWRRRRR